MTLLNQQFLLAQRPVGAPTRDTFEFVEKPVGEPGPNQILVKVEYLSIDPAMALLSQSPAGSSTRVRPKRRGSGSPSRERASRAVTGRMRVRSRVRLTTGNCRRARK